MVMREEEKGRKEGGKRKRKTAGGQIQVVTSWFGCYSPRLAQLVPSTVILAEETMYLLPAIKYLIGNRLRNATTLYQHQQEPKDETCQEKRVKCAKAALTVGTVPLVKKDRCLWRGPKRIVPTMYS